MTEISPPAQECFSVVDILKRKLRSDGGFSGYLHAVTGVIAVEVLFIVALLMGWGDAYLRVGYIALIIAFALAWIGATLYPDLDNSKSTSHSAFGFIGEGLSVIFRVTSAVIQTVVRTPRDDASPNPHRGFYHTLLSAGLIGFGVWMLTKLPQHIELPVLGEITLGQLFGALFLSAMIHLFLSSLGKKRMAKIRNGFAGEIIAFLIAVLVALLLISFIPAEQGYLWLGIAIAAGGATHIIGDTFTKQGTPLFFPLTVFTKKRFWWYTRFAKVESGGDDEKNVIIPLMSGLSVLLFFVVVALAIF